MLEAMSHNGWQNGFGSTRLTDVWINKSLSYEQKRNTVHDFARGDRDPCAGIPGKHIE